MDSARCPAPFPGRQGREVTSPPILCHHQRLLVVVAWLVDGGPAAEPAPGREESILATVAPVASLLRPQSKREELRIPCSLHSPLYSPFYLREGKKLHWGSTYPLPHPLILPSVLRCNRTASACLSVLTSLLFNTALQDIVPSQLTAPIRALLPPCAVAVTLLGRHPHLLPPGCLLETPGLQPVPGVHCHGLTWGFPLSLVRAPGFREGRFLL